MAVQPVRREALDISKIPGLCAFQWFIEPPFVPGQVLQTRFYHLAATITEWLVTLQLEERRIGEREIRVTLELDNWGEERKEIYASSVAIVICFQGRNIATNDDQHYTFNASNQYKFCLTTTADMPEKLDPRQQMVVIVTLCLRQDAISGKRPTKGEESSDQRGNSSTQVDIPSVHGGESSNQVDKSSAQGKESSVQGEERPSKKEWPTLDNDLMCVSKDLSYLGKNPYYFNVELHASDGRVFQAHSFILMVRWKNFFKRHAFNTVENTVVHTGISSDLLEDLLDYMYSGRLPGNFPQGERASYMAELFQVIDWYGIYHLYILFAITPFHQLRFSKKPTREQPIDIMFQYDSGRELNYVMGGAKSQKYWPRYGVQLHRGTFLITLDGPIEDGVGPWLSYSIQCNSGSWVHAQVVLELLKVHLRSDGKREATGTVVVHTKSYSIMPKQGIDSGPVLFLGCLETFGDLPVQMPSGMIELWVRLNISLADRTSIDLFENEHGFYNNLSQRLHFLSLNMQEVFERELHVDMTLESRSADNDSILGIRFAHRAILWSRVPQLRELLVTFQESKVLPNRSAVRLSYEVLSYVLRYIYTGKLRDAPQHILDQILEFAIRSKFDSLESYVTFLLES